MFSLNNNVVYVKGASRGAVYDFNTGKVFSVNQKACGIIERYIKLESNDDDLSYLENLRKNNLISDVFMPEEFNPELNTDIKLNMAWIEVTQACNLRCLHCYEGNNHKAGNNVLSLSEWKNVIDQLASLEISRLIIIGGEPCCNPNITEIIEHAAKYKTDITLFTNGTCFNDRIFDAVIKNKIGVKISLYGHCAEVHDSVTGVKGSFEKMTRTVKILTENNITVSSAIIIMKENERYTREIQEFAKLSGMKCSRYDVIREVFSGTQKEHIPSDPEIISKVYLRRPNFRADKELFVSNMNRNSCFYGKITVQENGDVTPCEFERGYVYGNIRKNTVSEIIHNERAKAMWFLDFSRVETCRECEFRFACHDCRPLGKSVNGSMFSRNPRCRYDIYSGKWGNVH